MAEKKPLLKEKALWFLIPIFVLYVVGMYFQNVYLQAPFTVTVVALIPGIFVITVSPKFSVKFVKIHKFFHKKKYYSYSFNENSFKLPSSIKFSAKNSLYTITILYTVLNWSGLMDESLLEGSRIVLVVMITSIALFAGSILHVSIYLLKQTGLMFENKQDSSKNSLGSEMLNKFDWALSPFLLISFAHSIILLSLNLSQFLGVMLAIVAISIYSSFFSFYFLKRKHFDRMISEIIIQLKKII